MTGELARQVADALGDEYVVPCPHSSIVGVPGVTEWVARPLIFRGRNSGLTMFAACRVGCVLCEEFREGVWDRRADVLANVAAWRRFATARCGDGWRATMAARMRERGIFP
jgi:hypothetical protein